MQTAWNLLIKSISVIAVNCHILVCFHVFCSLHMYVINLIYVIEYGEDVENYSFKI